MPEKAKVDHGSEVGGGDRWVRGLGWGPLLQSRLLKENVDCEERRLANQIFSAPRGAFTLAAASHISLACNNWSRACCSEAALPTRSGLTWQGRGKAVTAHLSVEGVENGLHQQDVRPTVHQRPHLCIKKAIISRRMPFNEQISLNRRGILAEL